MARDPKLRSLQKNGRFTEAPEGLGIDVVDEAYFAMFGLGGDGLLPAAHAEHGADRYDPRNRRMSITLAWTGAGAEPAS